MYQKQRLEQKSMVLNEKYILSNLIGQGSFGSVYKGTINLNNNKHVQEKGRRYLPSNVAIKVENDLMNSQIANQIVVIQNVNDQASDTRGFPKIYASGIESGNYYMIMQLLGPNLYDLMLLCGGHFTLKTSIYLTIQILQRVKVLHDAGFIYRDIKPQNFVMGIGKNSNRVYIVDFGLCKRFRDENTKLKMPYKQNVSMVGTIRYSSINSHLGIDQTQRDDIQSIFYLLIYFLKGELPWQSLSNLNRSQKDHMIMQMKLKISPEQLCQGLPPQLYYILQYIKNLDYYKDIDYNYITNQLTYLLREYCNNQTSYYDWQHFDKEVTLNKSNLQICLNYKHNKQAIKPQQSIQISQQNIPKSKYHKQTKFKQQKIQLLQMQ